MAQLAARSLPAASHETSLLIGPLADLINKEWSLIDPCQRIDQLWKSPD